MQPASALPMPFQPQPASTPNVQNPLQSENVPSESPMQSPVQASWVAFTSQAEPTALPVGSVAWQSPVPMLQKPFEQSSLLAQVGWQAVMTSRHVPLLQTELLGQSSSAVQSVVVVAVLKN